jgi:hypothetical protein
MISGSNGERMWTSREVALARLERLGRAQCSCLPAPSSATGTSSLRRTRASISRRTAGLLGASRWQIESRLTTPCARKRAVEQIGDTSLAEAGFGGLSQPKCRVISS